MHQSCRKAEYHITLFGTCRAWSQQWTSTDGEGASSILSAASATPSAPALSPPLAQLPITVQSAG